jgi:hypothetical protein
MAGDKRSARVTGATARPGSKRGRVGYDPAFARGLARIRGIAKGKGGAGSGGGG